VAVAAEAQLARMEGQELTDESLLLMTSVPDRLAEGRALFEQFCVVCHASEGQGNVGPNLTDAYWLHGNKPLDIHKTVTEGVPDKGMAAWGNQLGPRRVQTVVAYVLTLIGKNVPGKAPQGDLVTEQTGD
jgi:cytochrome c oxidase cbb3-type subunit 3